VHHAGFHKQPYIIIVRPGLLTLRPTVLRLLRIPVAGKGIGMLEPPRASETRGIYEIVDSILFSAFVARPPSGVDLVEMCK
jgi:hypothetical protein